MSLPPKMWRQSIRLFSQKTRPPPISKSPSSANTLPPRTGINPHYTPNKRIFTIVVAFAAGFSIHFFLDDPVPPLQKTSISPKTFVPSKVIYNKPSGPDTKLLKIAAPNDFHPRNITRNKFDSIWSVFIKDDDIQVERPYTPLHGIDDDGNMLFWIKKYPKGEVGRWLHTKAPGDDIELRGPLTTWPWKEDTWDEIVMISGGTGITPFVQLFHNVISKSNPTSRTRFTLLHASRVPQELPPAPLMEPLLAFAAKNPQTFKLHLFVDEQDGSKPPVPFSQIHTGRITEQSLKRCIDSEESEVSWWNRILFRPTPKDTSQRSILFLVCGPEPMIGALAGPYGRNLSQGSIGGILGKMGYNSNQVYKL